MKALQLRKINAALELIGPMAEMIEALVEVISAHHPGAVWDIDDCSVCVGFADDLDAILGRWDDVRAKVIEYWDV